MEDGGVVIACPQYARQPTGQVDALLACTIASASRNVREMRDFSVVSLCETPHDRTGEDHFQVPKRFVWFASGYPAL